MNELLKAIISFSWSMSLLGIKQIANVIAPPDQSHLVGKATAVFNSVTYATEEQFDDAIRMTFRTGDQLQRWIVNLIYGILTPESFNTRDAMKMGLDLIQQSAETFKLLVPGQGSRLVWQEFMNKLQAFSLFEHVDSELKISSADDLSLAKLVERAYTLEPFLAVWATEGLGHYHAERVWEHDGPPKNLLKDAHASALPVQGMTALHAGMGLSFADHVLEGVKPQSLSLEIRNALEKFITLCRDNSTVGYVGAAYESLGLVARNLYPQMVLTIDQHLSEIDRDLLSYFWHGVGRAIYFAPTNFLPCANSTWRGVEMTDREPPHELGRLNALAGLSWALTLVNIRQPEILETLLKHHGERLSQGNAFSNGLMSSIIVWRDSTRDDRYISCLCQHQPDSSDSRLVKLWKDLVKGPCEDALQDYYAVLKERHCLGVVFRYQSLSELIARLRGEPRAGKSLLLTQGVSDRLRPLEGMLSWGEQGKNG